MASLVSLGLGFALKPDIDGIERCRPAEQGRCLANRTALVTESGDSVLTVSYDDERRTREITLSQPSPGLRSGHGCCWRAGAGVLVAVLDPSRPHRYHTQFWFRLWVPLGLSSFGLGFVITLGAGAAIGYLRDA